MLSSIPPGTLDYLGPDHLNFRVAAAASGSFIGSHWQRLADMDGKIFAGSEHETSGQIRMPKVRHRLRSLSALRPEVAAQPAKTPVAIAVPVTGR